MLQKPTIKQLLVRLKIRVKLIRQTKQKIKKKKVKSHCQLRRPLMLKNPQY